MTRMQQFNEEVRQVISNNIMANMPEVNFTNASFCSDLENEYFSFSWTDFKIPAGDIVVSKWITDNGFTLCKKSEATALLRVGEKCPDSGFWIIGKTKNYWIKPSLK